MYRITEEYGHAMEGTMSNECFVETEDLAKIFVKMITGEYNDYLTVDDESYCRDWDNCSDEENEAFEELLEVLNKNQKYSFDFYNVRYEEFNPEICGTVEDIRDALNG